MDDSVVAQTQSEVAEHYNCFRGSTAEQQPAYQDHGIEDVEDMRCAGFWWQSTSHLETHTGGGRLT